MTFGEKIKQERLKRGMDQKHFAALIGVSFRTVQNYETKNVLPRTRDAYRKIAAALGCEVNFLLSEDEEFVLQAQQSYGYKGARDAEELVAGVSALFAGGELSENDKDAVMRALQDAYWMAKERNKEKYTPKKYRNPIEVEE